MITDHYTRVAHVVLLEENLLVKLLGAGSEVCNSTRQLREFPEPVKHICLLKDFKKVRVSSIKNAHECGTMKQSLPCR
jgi:hypothetical protein